MYCLCSFSHFQDDIPQSVSRALCSFGTNNMQGLITKWTAPISLWLSLCALLCMGTWWVSLDTQTTHQLSLRWMLVYASSQGEWGAGLPGPYCRGCVRGERLHSVYIIKARRTHRGLQMQKLPLSGFASVFLSLTLTDTVTLTYTSFTCCSSHKVIAFTLFGLQ